MPDTIVSHHRLIQPYRALLVGLWLLPPGLLLVLAVVRITPLLNPRLWLMLAAMGLPTLHIWQQGIDVCEKGLTLRIYLPTTIPFHDLQSWQVQHTPAGRVLIMIDTDGHTVLSFFIAHLTHEPQLLQALNNRVQLRDYVRR